MEIYLISNNLYENNLSYANKGNIDEKKLTRPLSVEGEKFAQELSLQENFENVSVIYSSSFSSALGTAKYLAERFDKKIIVEEKFCDVLVGELTSKPFKMVKFMQEHEFSLKNKNGESINEAAKRMDDIIGNIIYLNTFNKVVIFTHERAILSYLTKHAKVGYNLDDNLVLEYNDKMIYDGSIKDYYIVKLDIRNKIINDINEIEL